MQARKAITVLFIMVLCTATPLSISARMNFIPEQPVKREFNPRRSAAPKTTDTFKLNASEVILQGNYIDLSRMLYNRIGYIRSDLELVRVKVMTSSKRKSAFTIMLKMQDWREDRYDNNEISLAAKRYDNSKKILWVPQSLIHKTQDMDWFLEVQNQNAIVTTGTQKRKFARNELQIRSVHITVNK